jgi:hypothetical protein
MSDYAIKKVCWLAGEDPAFLAQLSADPAGTLASCTPPLSEDEQAAFLAGDVAALSGMGASRYLLMMLARLGLFGLTMPSFVGSLKAAYDADPTGRPDISY